MRYWSQRRTAAPLKPIPTETAVKRVLDRIVILQCPVPPQHKRKGDIPTNGRFLFYELEQRGVIPKSYGINPKTGNKQARTPLQDVSEALMHLREHNLIRWDWIEDEN